MLLGWEKAVFQYLHCCSSQVRTSEMERVCYEKSQSKTNVLPFVTVPEAMHHKLGQTKEDLALNAACGSVTHLRGIVPGTSLLPRHWCLVAFALLGLAVK